MSRAEQFFSWMFMEDDTSSDFTVILKVISRVTLFIASAGGATLLAIAAVAELPSWAWGLPAVYALFRWVRWTLSS